MTPALDYSVSCPIGWLFVLEGVASGDDVHIEVAISITEAEQGGKWIADAGYNIFYRGDAASSFTDCVNLAGCERCAGVT